MFKKGQSGNPVGRPKSPEIEELRLALKKVQQKKGKSFLIHFVERAYENDACAIALAKKIIADKVHVDDPGLNEIARTFLIRAKADEQSSN